MSLSIEDQYLLHELLVPIDNTNQYESQRLQKLRNLQILDSNQQDFEYNRFTLMAQRLFQVPIALVSLVDVDRQWFKSNIGLSDMQTHRNLAFCSYTCLPFTEDVMVIHDALNDIRFKESKLVLGPPYIRFYAGAAIIIDGYKIGSLCIIDIIPHTTFTIEEKMTLLDIANMISIKLQNRRKHEFNIQYERAIMIMNFMNEMKYYTKEMNQKIQTISTNSNQYIEDDKISYFIEDIKQILYHLSIRIELNLLLGPVVLRKPNSIPLSYDTTSNLQFLSIKATRCDIFTTIQYVKNFISNIIIPNSTSCRIDWLVDNTSFQKGFIAYSFPDVLIYVLSDFISKHMNTWGSIRVFISFQQEEGLSSTGKSNDKFSISIRGKSAIRGKIHVQLHVSKLSNNNSNAQTVFSSGISTPLMNKTSNIVNPPYHPHLPILARSLTSSIGSYSSIHEYYPSNEMLNDVGGTLEINSTNQMIDLTSIESMNYSDKIGFTLPCTIEVNTNISHLNNSRSHSFVQDNKKIKKRSDSISISLHPVVEYDGRVLVLRQHNDSTCLDYQSSWNHILIQLRHHNFYIDEIFHVEGALDILQTNAYDMLVLDLNMVC